MIRFEPAAILFDLDGVLVDSNAVAERHWRLWAERHGLPVADVLADHHGVPTRQTMRRFLPDLSDDDLAREAFAKESVEADDLAGVAAFPGAAELLASLPPDRWTIVTSGTRRTATTRLEHLGLPTPRQLVTADDVANGKPDPEPYRTGAERLGIAPEDCLVFEDAPAGIAAGQAAGAKAIGLATSTGREALSAADAVADRLTDVQVEVAGERLVVAVPAPEPAAG